MSDAPIRILMIEDSLTFQRAMHGFLDQAFVEQIEVLTAKTLQEGIDCLGENQDVSCILLDLMLPDSEGIDTFLRLRDQGVSVPIVLLTAIEDENMGLELIKQGAQDYLVKRHVNSDMLARTVRHSIERVRAERELAATRDRALESTRLKSQFLATMSHEMRTPMNGIVGMADLLLGTDLDSEQTEYAQTISLCAESLLNLINDTLDFSKIEAGKLTLESIPFDLYQTTGSVVEVLAERAESKGIEMVIFVDRDTPRTVRGDPARLRQVLLNLAGNAVKFTDRGTVVVRVETVTQDTGAGRLRFSVRDTGIGITPEAQAGLFEPFVQADGTTTRKFGGTGLGLAICKQLVEAMGGSIGVESSLGSGSTFEFSLDLPTVEASEPYDVAQHIPANRKALIVDPNPTNTRLLEYYLKSWNLRTSLASGGQEALAALYRQAESGSPYHLILIASKLADMEGMDLAMRIHDDSLLRGTRIIAVCPFSQRPDSAALRLAGVRVVLPKPVLATKLAEAVCSALDSTDSGPSKTAEHTSSRISEQARLQCRVLLAEDNAVNQKLAVRLLAKLGYSADVVENGLDAVERVRNRDYDIVLMDCQMPEMDGYQATAEIRRLEGDRRRTSIIAMTANAMVGDRERCLDAGMDDYLAKPVQPAALKTTLDRWALRAAETEPAIPSGD